MTDSRTDDLCRATFYRIDNDTFTAAMEDTGEKIPLTQMLINVGVLVPAIVDREMGPLALIDPRVVKAVGVVMTFNQAKKLSEIVLTAVGIGKTP